MPRAAGSSNSELDRLCAKALAGDGLDATTISRTLEGLGSDEKFELLRQHGMSYQEPSLHAPTTAQTTSKATQRGESVRNGRATASGGGWRSVRMLDGVNSLAALYDLDNEQYQLAIGEDMQDDLRVNVECFVAKLRGLRLILPAVDRFARRAFGYLLVDAMAMSPLPERVHSFLVATVLGYEGAEEQLREQVGAALARIDPSTASDATDTVMRMSGTVHDLHGAFRNPVFFMAKQLVDQLLPHAREKTRTATVRDEAEHWNGVVAELEWLQQDIHRLQDYAIERLKSATRPLATWQATSIPARDAPAAPKSETSSPIEESTGTRFNLLEVD